MMGSAAILAYQFAGPLLAQQGRVNSLGSRFRSRGAGMELHQLLLLLTIIVAIGIAVWLLARYFGMWERPGAKNPRRLFRELCRAHALDRAKRRLLVKLARGRGLTQPARLFLEPDQFDSTELPRWSPQDRAQLVVVRDQLFGRRIDQTSDAKSSRGKKKRWPR